MISERASQRAFLGVSTLLSTGGVVEENHVDLAPPCGFHQLLPQFAFGRSRADSFTCMMMVQPRAAAYSRIARFCIARVCWSLVETRAYRPARNIFDRLRAWPKTCADFAFGEARFMGISECHPIMATVDRFRSVSAHTLVSARVISTCPSNAAMEAYPHWHSGMEKDL